MMRARGGGMTTLDIGFGGGCHWCTEAVHQSLRGVRGVKQGFIKSHAPHDTYSEAALVTFDPEVIPLDVLIDVHLRTHASTSPHKMRGKYRSAIYVMSPAIKAEVRAALKDLQTDFAETLVTSVLLFDGFKPSLEQFHDYYQTDPTRPFCKTYIDPKLAKIRREFADYNAPAPPVSTKTS